MGAKGLRPSGRKDRYIQVRESGQRYLGHVGTRENEKGVRLVCLTP
jgi:hypothetical protein